MFKFGMNNLYVEQDGSLLQKLLLIWYYLVFIDERYWNNGNDYSYLIRLNNEVSVQTVRFYKQLKLTWKMIIKWFQLSLDRVKD